MNFVFAYVRIKEVKRAAGILIQGEDVSDSMPEMSVRICTPLPGKMRHAAAVASSAREAAARNAGPGDPTDRCRMVGR